MSLKPTLEAEGPIAGRSPRRWLMLLVLVVGFVAMTFNWFVMPAVFAGMSASFGLEIPQIAFVVSAFVIGYAAMHIPAGFLATRFGLLPTMTVGLALEGVLTSASALAPDYPTMLVMRILAGGAASVFAGIGISAASIWFRGRDHAFALGCVSASFSVGVALGLYGWSGVVDALGWRAGLALAGGVAIAASVLVAACYRPPVGVDNLAGMRLSPSVFKEILGSPVLWRFGLSFLIGYGGYFVVAQLIEAFAGDQGYSDGVGALAALMAGVAGLPGSLVAGWLSDRTSNRAAYFAGFVLLQAIGTVLIPFAGETWLWFAAFLVGFAYNGTFAIWQTVPADVARIAPEHIGTACGLLLTIGGIGGFLVPWIFGIMVPRIGYPAAWVSVGVATAICLVFIGLRPRRT